MEQKHASPATILATMVAPIAWGTSYAVTTHLLPPGRPFLAAALRALPIGLVITAVRHRLPRGEWWWKAAVLGVCNFAAFFALIFIAAYRLPGGLAATIQALSPLFVIGLAAVMLAERPTLPSVLGAVLGLGGVSLLVLRAGTAADPIGIAAAVLSVVVSGVGFILVKRWHPPVDMLTLTGWQLVAGGVILAPVALLVEGPPPVLTARNWAGYAWLAILGTGIAYVCWFRGLRRMTAAATSVLGLVNPVVATLLGIALSHEPFGPWQAVGMVLVFAGVLIGQPTVLAAARRVARRRPAG